MNNPVYRQPRTVRLRQISNIIQLNYAHTHSATQNAPSDPYNRSRRILPLYLSTPLKYIIRYLHIILDVFGPKRNEVTG